MDINHCGYIVKVKELRKHPNADKLYIATFFGNDTCVSIDTQVGDIGVYFPCDLQLSLEFCIANHLCRKLPDGTADTGYMEVDKRNITAIRLRGERSDGLYLPIKCFDYCYDDDASAYLKVGDIINEVNGHPICNKYIPRTRKQNNTNSSNVSKTRKHKDPIAPLFKEHIDTAQLAYNLSAFKPGDLIEITRKRTLWDKITRKDGKPIYQYDYIDGTRRTLLVSYDGGFYGSNEFRKHFHEAIKGKLHEGETCYAEIVGFTDDGTPIMGSVSNKKTNDKAFIKQYGDMTTFSYGCDPTGVTAPKNDFYIYRMTLTTHDGYTVEYSPEYTRYRCEQMGVKFVPVEWRGYIPEHPACEDDDTITAGEWIMRKAEQYYDGPEPIDPRHVREGVVVRLIDKPSFTAYKIKNFSFKCIEGIAVADTTPVDETIAEEL